MKREIRIYKSPEELCKSFMYQQRHLNYQKENAKKIALPRPDFSAS